MADVESALNLSDETKLFQVVTSRSKKQVLRYITPSSNAAEPLWTARKNKLENGAPKCERCGSSRNMELQITPQLFDYCAPLRLVDWDTIVMYTCSNLGGCIPKGDSLFAREFAYIQFSEDCQRA
jgi:hypothetical protein